MHTLCASARDGSWKHGVGRADLPCLRNLFGPSDGGQTMVLVFASLGMYDNVRSWRAQKMDRIWKRIWLFSETPKHILS